MMAALYMLCAWLSSPVADGGDAIDPAAVRVGGGVFGLLPAATLRAEVPVDGITLAVRYDTAAGLAHDVGLAGRMAWGRARVEVEVAHGFFGIEEIAGIGLDDAPLGHGLTTTASGLWRWQTRGGHTVDLGGGLTARWTGLDNDFGVLERTFDPALHHVHGEARVDWDGGVWLRFRAVVPIEAELKVIGFWPQVLVGYRWGL